MSEPLAEQQVIAPLVGSARVKSAVITTIAWFRDLMLSVLIAMLIILFLVSTRQGRRNEHDAESLRPGAAIHQSVQL